MFVYLELINGMSLAVSHIASPMLRCFSQFVDLFSLSYFKETILKFTEVVENRIGEYMKNHCGAILHYAWAFNGSNYFGLYASYMMKLLVIRNRKHVINELWVMQLLGTSSMALSSVTPKL